ncbi:hypothetical protein [Actinokineospora sp. NBRC 105648]|uniref:hypothetical protein n=1 Tax=Actinokineospora sp. NBRC 105648 TaxID=3032206 RepID=UPI0024A0C84A|nr:hypothetical protein [Actinokineospora sp. NBRC 105648]GLZ38891.1 hypothetical protein Acsp05_25150 [Actinokineospora sp. NBRC 105648]
MSTRPGGGTHRDGTAPAPESHVQSLNPDQRARNHPDQRPAAVDSQPDQHARPDQHIRPEQRGQLDEHARSDQYARPEQSAQLDRHAPLDEYTRPDQHLRPNQHARPDQHIRPEQSAQLDRHAQLDEHTRPDQHLRPDQHAGPDQQFQPDQRPESHGTVLNRQKARFGGIKWGSAFFGWLTAIGTAVLLSALVVAVGGAMGLSMTTAEQARQGLDTTRGTGLAGAITAAAVLLVAYYCGGYVAGRMARFHGMKQGIAVWVWTIVITVVVAILAAVAGVQFDALTDIDGLPQLPTNDGALAITVGAVLALAVALIGSILGGLAGMRFHRKIDRADLDAP